jgi:pseudaminic acid synthase
MKIYGSPIGGKSPVYIIAELSANHANKLQHAIDTVRAAKDAGADAIKLQTYTAATMTLPLKKAPFLIQGGTPWDGRNLYDLYTEAHTPWEWHDKLMNEAERVGIDCFSTAFDPTSLEFLEKLGVGIHKIASFEIVDIPLIEKMAKTGKPMIISTGMATLEEIDDAVKAARRAGCTELALLKCTSAYPAPFREMNLRTIPDLAEKFNCPVGLSDHTLGIAVPIASVSIGASIIEKHFTLSRAIKGPDSAFSLEPTEFQTMVESIRAVEAALGKVEYGITENQKGSLVFRRSLFIVEDVKAGEVLTEKNVRSIRPGNGMPPKYLTEILGKPASVSMAAGTPLTWEKIQTQPKRKAG